MSLTLIGADLVAVTILIFGLFLPRHGRRDLIMAYLVVNIGVMAVASALITSTVSAGLGLGLGPRAAHGVGLPLLEDRLADLLVVDDEQVHPLEHLHQALAGAVDPEFHGIAGRSTSR